MAAPLGDRFTVAGFDSRPNTFTGFAFVPGSDAYVQEIILGNSLYGYRVGSLGVGSPRAFNTLAAAVDAARQLAAVPSTNAAPNVRAVDAFWGPFQGEKPAPSAAAAGSPWMIIGAAVAAGLLWRR